MDVKRDEHPTIPEPLTSTDTLETSPPKETLSKVTTPSKEPNCWSNMDRKVEKESTLDGVAVCGKRRVIL